MHGYNGVIALVNLNTQSVEQIYFDEELAKKFIGGVGLGVYFLMKYSSPEVAPLSPDNPLIYMTGPFTGTAVPGSGSHHIVTKSPLTGLLGTYAVDGTFGEQLKKAGYDGLIIVGKADMPVYLFVYDNNILFKDASSLWGLDSPDTMQKIQKEFTSDSTISAIGPTRERSGLTAEIFHDGIASPTSERGIGVVMGSKQIKAIAVIGSGPIRIANINALNEYINEKFQNLGKTETEMNNLRDNLLATIAPVVQLGCKDKPAELSKELLTAKIEDLMELADSLAICKNTLQSGAVKILDLLNFTNYITGWELSIEEFLKIGERIFTLKSMYNNVLGVNYSWDILPGKADKDPKAASGTAKILDDLGLQLQEYYDYRGWLANGIPSIEKIKDLGFEEFLSWHRSCELLA